MRERERKRERERERATESCFRHPLFDLLGTQKRQIMHTLISTFLPKKVPQKVEKKNLVFAARPFVSVTETVFR